MQKLYPIILAFFGATISTLILAYVFMRIRRYIQWVRGSKVHNGYTYEVKWLWFWIKLEPREYAASPSGTDAGVNAADLDMRSTHNHLGTEKEIVWTSGASGIVSRWQHLSCYRILARVPSKLSRTRFLNIVCKT
ncbi:hypothetical protein E6O75_ATG10235 [Venturia nashicola]|uniref:Uncharacterized protein n=1 Tax=Venturia nashicola TaxID=86259 RepID=A0A4Z1NJZ3_9PEZI|nr:hypothetical protein E6O75_ATG10235 [Venturia nashicola]